MYMWMRVCCWRERGRVFAWRKGTCLVQTSFPALVGAVTVVVVGVMAMFLQDEEDVFRSRSSLSNSVNSFGAMR